MPFKIVRNDITRMNTEAVVNTANARPVVGGGCDHAVYTAAGYEELLAYRREHIGFVKEGDAFITPGFKLPAKYIIHAVSPLYTDGSHEEEELLRSCYQKSLALAAEYGIRSIAFPLISTGGFGYPKEEGMRIAVDEIHAFLLNSDMQICLVVFDEKATEMGRNLYPGLEAYIDLNYVEERHEEEYGDDGSTSSTVLEGPVDEEMSAARIRYREDYWRRKPLEKLDKAAPLPMAQAKPSAGKKPVKPEPQHSVFKMFRPKEAGTHDISEAEYIEEASLSVEKETTPDEDFAIEEIERKLAERMAHMSDTFSQYLLYLISEKGMENAEVYKRAIVDKKVFSKIKNNPEYHPQKLTALCLCIGAELSMDESRDLLSRAGYALSPCNKTDIIFSYFIEKGIYDMIELDIQLEEHGLPCIIT